ncbi:MAG TPA: FHA domain-containing protein [Edaphobacter sp.]|nr:FHA domain-containing protein [Edaphobacter sp.]
MNVYRGLYFSTLVGAIGGLLAWASCLLTSIPLADFSSRWLPDTLALLFFGLFLGVLLFTHFDRAITGKTRPGSIGWGMLFGLLSAIVASFIILALQRTIAVRSPILFRLAAWAIGISVVSLGLGLRWVRSNRARVIHTYAGGLLGGLLGGFVYVLFSPHLSAGTEMCGLLVAGAGTGFGAGIAPILVRDGLMRFISSGDARAQSKLGKARKEWDLEPEESYILGSMITAQGGVRFQQGADICIPDASIAPRHAVLFSREGRFYIARHPDAAGPEGIAKFVLRIKGKTVVTSQELHPADDVLVGRTALRFECRKSGE